MSIHRKSKHDINLMKQAGNIVALVHAAMKESVKEGITTQELNDIAYIDEETHKKQLNTALEQNDVLLNITGASIGRCAIVNEMIVNGNVNQHVCIIRSNGAVDSEFLCNYLLSNYGQKQIDSFQAGGNRQGLNFEQIKSIRISIPTLDEQKHIAKLLCAINQRIETQNKIIEDLKKLRSAIAEKLFADRKGQYVKLGNISSITNGNGDVQDARTDYHDWLFPFFDRSGEQKYFDTYSFDKEAIIYAGEGLSFMPRYYNGKFALHQRCYAITDFADIIIPQYCYHYMKTLNSYFIRNAVGSTVPSLRIDTFQKAPILLLDKETQYKICDCLNCLDSKYNTEIGEQAN